MLRRSKKTSTSAPKRSWLRRALWLPKWLVLGFGLFYVLCAVHLLSIKVLPVSVTSVQVQRHVEGLIEGEPLRLRYDWVPRSAMSPHLAHAVVAAEDGRFFEHHGVDWEAVQKAIEERMERGRVRGGSTITQQLVKNLYLTTHSSWLRKALEFPLAYLADLILTKDEILTTYLNVVEFGDGVFGVEAAAQHYWGTSAADLSRDRAARLAAVLPAPRSRSPQNMGRYAGTIQARMRQHGW